MAYKPPCSAAIDSAVFKGAKSLLDGKDSCAKSHIAGHDMRSGNLESIRILIERLLRSDSEFSLTNFITVLPLDAIQPASWASRRKKQFQRFWTVC